MNCVIVGHPCADSDYQLEMRTLLPAILTLIANSGFETLFLTLDNAIERTAVKEYALSRMCAKMKLILYGDNITQSATYWHSQTIAEILPVNLDAILPKVSHLLSIGFETDPPHYDDLICLGLTHSEILHAANGTIAKVAKWIQRHSVTP